MAFDLGGGGGIFQRQTMLALRGELKEYLEEAEEAVLRAAKSALHTVAELGKERLRGMVVRAGLGRDGAGSGRGSGRSLASAIRFDVYPKTGLARDPAALLYIQPSALHIFTAFEDGATIQSKTGGFITIPIPGSPASREVFGDKPRGQSILDKLKGKGIEIAYVPGRNGHPAMLVANSVRLREDKRGRTRVTRAARRKTGGLAKGAGSVPLFWLVPQAKAPKKLSLAREFQRTADEFYNVFAREFAAALDRVAAAG